MKYTNRGGPHFIRYAHGRHEQKSARRARLNLRRPKVCPTCRQYTRQSYGPSGVRRVCLACGYVWLTEEART